jgi:outer membrane protein
MIMRRIFITLISLASTALLYAQPKATEPPAGAWTLADCLAYAKEHNISISSLRLGQESAEQDVIGAKAARLPDLTASVSQSLANTSNGITPASGYGVSSAITIYNGGYLNNDIAQKQLYLQSAGLSVLQQENDVTLQITQSFYNIAMAKENIKAVQDLVTTSEAQVKQGEQLFNAGSIAKKDLLQLQAVLANDRYNLTAAGNSEKQQELTLKQILQLPSTTDFQTTAPDTLSASSGLAPLKEVQQIALDSRPEITGSRIGIQIAELDLEKARASGKPVISLGASMNTNYANTGSYAKNLGTNFYQQAGVSLSVPIFNRKSTQTSVAKAKISIQQANLTASGAKIALMQEVEQAYLNLQNAVGQYSSSAEQLRYAGESYRIANEQLKIGTYNMPEFLQQRNLYVQAVQSYVQAKYAASLYSKIYAFYNGVPVTQ